MMRTLEMYEIGPDDIGEQNITLQWESKPADKGMEQYASSFKRW